MRIVAEITKRSKLENIRLELENKKDLGLKEQTIISNHEERSSSNELSEKYVTEQIQTN